MERRDGALGPRFDRPWPGGHDDLANAVAGVLVGVDLDRRQPLVRLSDVFGADGRAPPLPRHCGMVVFAAVAMEGADVAVVFAVHLPGEPPLYILDAVAGPLWRDFFADTAARLQELKRACNAQAAAVFTPADLIPLFEMPGLIVRSPPDWFDAETSLAFAAGMTSRGLVKFCAPVADKMKTQSHRGGVGVQGGRCGRDGAQGGVHPGDLPEVRHEADEPPPGVLMRRVRPGQRAG